MPDLKQMRQWLRGEDIEGLPQHNFFGKAVIETLEISEEFEPTTETVVKGETSTSWKKVWQKRFSESGSFSLQVSALCNGPGTGKLFELRANGSLVAERYIESEQKGFYKWGESFLKTVQASATSNILYELWVINHPVLVRPYTINVDHLGPD